MKLSKLLEEKKIMIILLMCLIVVASVPAFRSAVYEGHDLNFHLGRIQAIGEALKNGQIPVRYESDAWNGYGYISSIFYGNILLYFPALLFNVGMPVYRAFNIYLILINVITVTIGYYSFKGLFKDSWWALLATILYTLAGYRLTNLYVRTALGEFTAMAFIPLCVYGIYRIFTANKDRNDIFDILPLVIGATGLIQSHVLTTQIVAMFIFAFILLNINTLRYVWKKIALSLVMILGVNAFFIIPFIECYTSLDLNIKNGMTERTVQGNGLYISQIFGLITEARGQNAIWSTVDEGCYNAGIILVSCEIITLVFIVSEIINYIRKIGAHNNISIEEQRKWLYQLMFLGIISMWMSSVYFPWDILKNIPLGRMLCTVQYPWRYLMIQNVIFIISGIYVLKMFIKNEKKKIILIICSLLMTTLITALFDYQLSFGKNRVDVYAPENWADTLYLPHEIDKDALNITEIITSEQMDILPKIAYPNVTVLDNDGNELDTDVVDGRIAINKDNVINGYTIRYIEPLLWRIAEATSVLFVMICCIMVKKRRQIQH